MSTLILLLRDAVAFHSIDHGVLINAMLLSCKFPFNYRTRMEWKPAVVYCLCTVFRVRLQKALVSALRQLYNDASDTVLIEKNGAAPEWGCNPIYNNSIDFNENSTASVIAELLQCRR